MEMMVGGSEIRFSFEKLRIMTDGFSSDNIILKSDHFNLFRGKIADQFQRVTVKIWRSSDKLDRLREEITILGHPRVLSCPNVVKLMGFCCEDDLVASVYKLEPLDTLENLFDKDDFQWRERMSVAIGIAHIFRCFGVQGISHLIHATLPSYIILDQERNPVLCDVRLLTGGTMLLDEGGEDSFVGNGASFSGKDTTAGKMKPNGIFALGMLVLRLARVGCNVLEDVRTKLPYIGYPILTSLSPFNSQLMSHSSFYKCDGYSVKGLVYECLEYDKKCLTIGEVVQKLENLLVLSLPFRKSCGKVALGGSKLVYFTYNDLCELTDKFSMVNLFAITNLGEAYRGRIKQGWKKMGAQDIVVKMWGQVNISIPSRSSKNSSLEDNICRLRDEVILLTQRRMIDNSNVVNLLGYCFEGNKVGAVYSAQPLYTLESLFDDEWFEWKDRIGVAMELARTIALFHEKEQYVICNLSAAHIMIDQDKKPILYDFSMLHGQVLSGQRAAKSFHPSVDYIDPNFMMTGLVVPKSDIFAFGGLLMSLICKQDMLVTIRSFAYKHMEYRFKSKSSFIHESFVNHPLFDYHDGHKLTKLAFDCLDDYPSGRPTASDIVTQLGSLSLFSDTPFSTEVDVKAIDSCSNIERKQSWRKRLNLFKKLSITPNRCKDQNCIPTSKARGSEMSSDSSHLLNEQMVIIGELKIPRHLFFEKTPEEIQSRIQLIDAAVIPENEKLEKRRESLRKMVKDRQSNFIKQLVVV